MVPSVAYRRFEQEALWQLKSCRNKYKGKVNIDFAFYMKGRLDSDIDNMISGLLDILQGAGIIEDDKQVMSISAIKTSGLKEWKTEIEITPIL